MKTGRPRKPTAIHILNGNPSKRPLNAKEPKPKLGIPACPAHLSRTAKRLWRELGERLHETKVISGDDGVALEMLVDAYAEYRRARAVVEKEGSTYTSSLDGTDEDTGLPLGRVIIRMRPEVIIMRDAWRRIHGMLTEFGLTPASRSKVSTLGAAATADPFEEMLSGRRQA